MKRRKEKKSNLFLRNKKIQKISNFSINNQSDQTINRNKRLCLITLFMLILCIQDIQQMIDKYIENMSMFEHKRRITLFLCIHFNQMCVLNL